MADAKIDPDNPREAFRSVLAMLEEQKLAHAKLQAKHNSLTIAFTALVRQLAASNTIDSQELESLMGKGGARFDQLMCE